MNAEATAPAERDTPATKSARTETSSASLAGMLWFGWLLTIGFADLGWWQALLALIIWPYYLGVAIG